MEVADNIIVYSTHCPKCKELEEKLHRKGLLFKVVDEQDRVMAVARRNNICMVPFVVVDEGGGVYRVLDCNQAIQYFKL